jgi:hypothetical protein
LKLSHFGEQMVGWATSATWWLPTIVINYCNLRSSKHSHFAHQHGPMTAKAMNWTLPSTSWFSNPLNAHLATGKRWVSCSTLLHTFGSYYHCIHMFGSFNCSSLRARSHCFALTCVTYIASSR